MLPFLFLFLSAPHGRPLPSVVASPSSSRSHIHYRPALCQSAMPICLLIQLMKFIPFFFFFLPLPLKPDLICIIGSISFPSRVVRLTVDAIPLSALWECAPYIINLWLMSTPLLISTSQLIRVNRLKPKHLSKHLKGNAKHFSLSCKTLILSL